LGFKIYFSFWQFLASIGALVFRSLFSDVNTSSKEISKYFIIHFLSFFGLVLASLRAI
jgi:hypothetical protein